MREKHTHDRHMREAVQGTVQETMRETKKKTFRILFSRLFIIAVMLLVQVGVIIAIAAYFSQAFFQIYLLFASWSFLTAIALVSSKNNPSFKITWLIAVLAFPSVGWLFYLIAGHKRMPTKLQRRIDLSLVESQYCLPPGNACAEALREKSLRLSRQASYIYNMSGYPLLNNAYAEYYPVGEKMFARMLDELKKAKYYIFMEYFIIAPGKMWDAVFDVLQRKVKEGVEVRLMYDDLGSISTMNKAQNQRIRNAGIKLLVFNPFRLRINVLLNHRDHRKITVVDGQVAFCGGINLADEYINELDRFGHWKDTGVMLRGEAAWPFAFMFLQQWQFGSGKDMDIDRYRAFGGEPVPINDPDGFVLPFGDSPLDDHNVTEMTYLSIISRATKYVYITTPYLVIDNEMEVALCTAAQSGVDVRIITPCRYDKWFVHTLTRSHYENLIRAGVRIYEYTPGFMHGKMFVADDNICMVGTCNMDFRSFYLHFECSVAFFLSSMIDKVKQDMLDCQKKCHLISLEEMVNTPLWVRLLRAVLKLVAPMM